MTLYYVFIIYVGINSLYLMDQLEKKATEVAHLLKLMAHPKRFLILCRLRDGERMRAREVLYHRTIPTLTVPRQDAR